MNLIKISFLIIFYFVIILVYTSTAQDTHNWNITYGTRATLLGGAVIGSVSDLSATYYNPGAVALFEEPKLILSARIYEYSQIEAKEKIGKGEPFSFSAIRPSPSFIAFALKFKWLGEDQLAFSILTRQSLNAEFITRTIETADILPDSPGEEDFAGGISFDQDFDEIWAGLTYAHKLSPKIGIGISPYLAYRGQDRTNQKIIQILKSDGGMVSLTDIRSFKYKNYRLLAKLGIGINLNTFTLGATLTSPSANLAGTGSSGSHFFLTGLDLTNDGVVDNQFISDYQEDIPSKYNSSWAVGFGGSYGFKKLRIHLSGEWFDAVQKFNALATRDFIAQSSGDTISNRLTHEAQGVFNFGVGLDFRQGKRTQFSVGFVTDFSSAVPGSETNLTRTSWDIYHLSGGASFTIGNSEMTLGLAYSFGSEILSTDISLPDFENDVNPIGTKSEIEFAYSRIKFLFGFNF